MYATLFQLPVGSNVKKEGVEGLSFLIPVQIKSYFSYIYCKLNNHIPNPDIVSSRNSKFKMTKS